MTGSFDLAALTLSDAIVSPKGVKTASLSYTGKPVVWQPDAQLVLFEPSAFQNAEASRVNLVMRASQQALDALTARDAYMIQFCTQHSQHLFGEPLSQDEVKSRYAPCLKASDKGRDPSLKAKMNVKGSGKLRCWDDARAQCEQPLAWSGCVVQPRIMLKCLWVMPNEFGCLLECSDVLIHETCKPVFECPF